MTVIAYYKLISSWLLIYHFLSSQVVYYFNFFPNLLLSNALLCWLSAFLLIITKQKHRFLLAEFNWILAPIKQLRVRSIFRFTTILLLSSPLFPKFCMTQHLKTTCGISAISSTLSFWLHRQLIKHSLCSLFITWYCRAPHPHFSEVYFESAGQYKTFIEPLRRVICHLSSFPVSPV